MSSYRHDPSRPLYPAFDAHSQQPRPGTAIHYQQPASTISEPLASGTGITQNEGGYCPTLDHSFCQGSAADHVSAEPVDTQLGWDRTVTTTTSNAAITPFTSDPLPQADSRTTQTNQNMPYGAYGYYNIPQNQYYGPSGNSGGQSSSYHGHTSARATEISSSRLDHSSTYGMPQTTSAGGATPGQEVHGVQTERETWIPINLRIPPVLRGSAQLDDGLFVEYYKEQDGTTVVHGRILVGRN